MILDLPVQMVFVPFLILAGISLVVYGKEILEVLSFAIGALAGGILAYMIFEGLFQGYVPFIIVLIVTVGLVIGGGFLGKGTVAMLLGLFAATVLVDVVAVFIGSDMEILLMVIGLLLFLALVPFTQKFMTVFSAFVGGTAFAMGITPFLDGLGIEVTRIIQITIIIVLCAAGAVAQHFIMKKIEGSKEEITWVPSGAKKSTL